MSDVIRADQVGSLLRPPALLDAREAFDAGTLSRDRLRDVEDSCILDALKMQEDAGLDVFGDGEFRRDSWQTPISEAVEGFADDYPVVTHKKPDGTSIDVVMHTKAVDAKLKPHRRLTDVDAAFLKANAPGPFKITMPSPSGVARTSFRPGISDPAYENVAALQVDTARIIGDEMKALASEGVTYFQLDEGFTPYVREAFHQQLKSDGLNIEDELSRDIEVENNCYDGVAGTGVTRAMHLCRGSRMSFVSNGGTYDWLAERLFDKLRVDRFLLEYDTEQIGGFEPLRFLPKGKIAVLGIVSSKDALLESVDDLCRRIEDAARFCPIDQLALSSQCGFQGAADRDGAHMTIDQQRLKLERIAETADKVWA